MGIDKRLEKIKSRNNKSDNKKITVSFLYDELDIEFIESIIKIASKKDSIYISNRLRDYNYYLRDFDNKGISKMIGEIDSFIIRYGNFIY